MKKTSLFDHKNSEPLDLALDTGFSGACYFKTTILRALPEVRNMCADGRCRRYNASWSCPPACGTLEKTEKQMRQYEDGLLVQTTGQLEDEFDAEGIKRTEQLHKRNFASLARQCRIMEPGCLPLSAGSCTVCPRCTYPDRPCRFPHRQFASMEAFGLLVSEVCEKAGLQYYYGPRTITFSSCILFNRNNHNHQQEDSQ